MNCVGNISAFNFIELFNLDVPSQNLSICMFRDRTLLFGHVDLCSVYKGASESSLFVFATTSNRSFLSSGKKIIPYCFQGLKQFFKRTTKRYRKMKFTIHKFSQQKNRLWKICDNINSYTKQLKNRFDKYTFYWGKKIYYNILSKIFFSVIIIVPAVLSQKLFSNLFSNFNLK